MIANSLASQSIVTPIKPFKEYSWYVPRTTFINLTLNVHSIGCVSLPLLPLPSPLYLSLQSIAYTTRGVPPDEGFPKNPETCSGPKGVLVYYWIHIAFWLRK